MRMDTPVANGDPTLAALIPEGVTLTHIIALFQDAYYVNGVQLLRARLGATHPANLAPPELAEFIKWALAALKSAGIRDPADALAYAVRLEAEAAAAKLGSSAAIGDLAAERKSDGHAPVTIENNSSTISDASIDSAAYLAACERAADRAGLLACNDITVAVELAGGPYVARHLVKLAGNPRYLSARRKLRARRTT